MRAWILGVCWLILCSCETEVTDFKTQNLSSAIVVSGEMSSLAGPYTVRLNYTSAYSPFDVTEFQGQVIPGADVKILDETGASVSLKETQKGVYQTSLFLKQGYYSYSYLTVNKNNSADKKELEGDYWETENTYTILIYYKLS